MPARAIGVKWLAVDPGARKLAVSLGTVAKTQPRQTLSIPVSVTGLPPATDAYVMVAAVDVGILNLTNYKAPDPEAWFFGQRQLGLELRDLYGRLIDGSLGATGRLRTGGDGAQMPTNGSAPTEKLVAFFSGPVRLDADGKATVNFDIPQFNGTVRVMTVAWTKDAVGHATLGRDRARSDRRHRQPAALPDARRQGGDAPRHRQYGRSCRRVHAGARPGRHRPRRLPGQAPAAFGQAPDADRADQRRPNRRCRDHHPSRLGRRTDGGAGRCRSPCVQRSCRSPRVSWSTCPATAAA